MFRRVIDRNPEWKERRCERSGCRLSWSNLALVLVISLELVFSAFKWYVIFQVQWSVVRWVLDAELLRKQRALDGPRFLDRLGAWKNHSCLILLARGPGNGRSVSVKG